MGIISMLKSALGVGGGPDRPTSPEPVGEPEAANERAVKGVDEPPTAEPEAPAVDGEPVEAIKGIGAAYAERLADAGVHTVADLATADAEALVEETGLGAGRLEGWIERARARTG